jgi:hypothetical protein
MDDLRQGSCPSAAMRMLPTSIHWNRWWGKPGGIPYTPNSKPQLGYGLGCFIMFHRWVYHIKETCGLSKNKCGYWIKQHDESPILATFGLWGPQSLVS